MICPRCAYPFAKVQQVSDWNRKVGDVWCDACKAVVSSQPTLLHDPVEIDTAKLGTNFGAKLMMILNLYTIADADGLTDEEMGLKSNLGSNSHRGCRIKLEDLGFVRRTNATRLTSSGRQARVFVAIQFWNGANAAPASAYSRRSQRCRHCGKLL